MRNEDELMRREEIERKLKQQQQYQQDQKSLEERLHKTLLDSVTKSVKQPGSNEHLTGCKKGGAFIAGRTQLFEEKAAELVNFAQKPSTGPKNFKYQVCSIIFFGRNV